MVYSIKNIRREAAQQTQKAEKLKHKYRYRKRKKAKEGNFL
jgi:hypothetical protein